MEGNAIHVSVTVEALFPFNDRILWTLVKLKQFNFNFVFSFYLSVFLVEKIAVFNGKVNIF